MKITSADLRTFEAVMAHYGLDSDEIESAKTAYRADPESGRTTYAALAAEIPAPVDTRQWVKLSGPRPATTPPFKPEKP